MKYEINSPVSTSFPSKASLKIVSDHNCSPAAKKNSSSCLITNEETRGLAGVVAKTRALFESNLNSQTFSTPQISTNKKYFKSFSSIQATKTKNSISIPIENELDKENSIQDKFNLTPIKSILPHKENNSVNKNEDNKKEPSIIKKAYSSNRISDFSSDELKSRHRLNSANIIINKCEEISKELNIPINVKQAKACFENLAQNFITPRPKSNFPNYSCRVNFIDTSKPSTNSLSEKNRNLSKNDAAMPEMFNSLTSSSSSTASESSVFNNSSSSSCENTPRLVDKRIIYKSPKVADRIKKLEEKKSFDEIKIQSTLPSSSFNTSVPCQWTNQNSQNSKSSKFVHLFQKQMEINTPNYRKLEDIINEADKNIKFEKQEKKLKSILRKGPKSESIVMSEIKIETKSNVRSFSCSSSSQSSSPSSSFSKLTIKPPEQTNEITKENIDDSCCMVPSKIRERTQSLDITNNQESNFGINNVSKMNNSFTGGIIKTPSKSIGSYIKNSSYSSGNSNSGVVKSFNKKIRVTRSATNAKEALIRWCRKMTEEYPNVSISNFSSSWSDGLAFCALLHHFMPNEFDYSTLNSENPRYNFDLAFKTAENKAGIVPLLDVNDMIEMGECPDWKCVFTYVHSIYQRFKEAS